MSVCLYENFPKPRIIYNMVVNFSPFYSIYIYLCIYFTSQSVVKFSIYWKRLTGIFSDNRQLTNLKFLLHFNTTIIYFTGAIGRTKDCQLSEGYIKRKFFHQERTLDNCGTVKRKTDIMLPNSLTNIIFDFCIS